MQPSYSFIATPDGILVNGLPLTKNTSQNIPSHILRYLDRAKELLTHIGQDEWDKNVPHTTNNVPLLAKINMLLALASPMAFGKYDPDQPRVSAGNPDGGQWTSGNNATVTIHSNKNITIHHSDGSDETRTGGSRSWRNNNPGNIISGTFANEHGAIGDNNGFAVFPDEETGEAASAALLNTSTYSDLTIDEAIARRSPPETNDTAQVQANVRNFVGFSGSEVIGDLNNEQLTHLVNAIKRSEGWATGTVIRTSAKP